MPSYAEYADLARMCAFNARAATEPRVADELWKMALEYPAKAAALDSGVKPEIGAPPDLLIQPN